MTLTFFEKNKKSQSLDFSLKKLLSVQVWGKVRLRLGLGYVKGYDKYRIGFGVKNLSWG
jgi:hypothetical protein